MTDRPHLPDNAAEIIFAEMRAALDATAYGGWVRDDMLRPIANKAAARLIKEGTKNA